MTVNVTRIVPYLESARFEAVTEFYTGPLGLEVGMDLEAYVGLNSPGNPTAQIVIAAPGAEDPLPRMGIDVGDPAAVDAVHAECRRRGLEVVYPLADEPWGIHRFFVRDPGGNVVSVLAHSE
jgi:catechol 2,3-dioxygenase-like lactoylglutathione lyase family enzyme